MKVGALPIHFLSTYPMTIIYLVVYKLFFSLFCLDTLILVVQENVLVI